MSAAKERLYYTDAQKQAQKKWNAANLERLSLSFKKGHRGAWERKAAESGLTLSAWVLATLDSAAGIDGPGAGDSPKE